MKFLERVTIFGWKNSNSLVLLEKVKELIEMKGWEVINIDSVVINKKPTSKLKPSDHTPIEIKIN